MINKKLILVFIKKDNQPVATAELFYNKKVGQFYGNETNRENCKPNDEVKKVFYEWLENVKIPKPKKEALTIGGNI